MSEQANEKSAMNASSPPYRPTETATSGHPTSLPKIPTAPVSQDLKNPKEFNKDTDSRSDDASDSELVSTEDETSDMDSPKPVTADIKQKSSSPDPKQKFTEKKTFMGNRLVSPVYVVGAQSNPPFENETRGPPNAPVEDDAANNNIKIENPEQGTGPGKGKLATPSAIHPSPLVVAPAKTPSAVNNILVDQVGPTQDLEPPMGKSTQDPAIAKSFTRLALRPEEEEAMQSRSNKEPKMSTDGLEQPSNFETGSSHSQTSKITGVNLDIDKKSKSLKKDKIHKSASNVSTTNSTGVTNLTIRNSEDQTCQECGYERDHHHDYRKPSKGFKNLFGCLNLFGASSRTSSCSTESER